MLADERKVATHFPGRHHLGRIDLFEQQVLAHPLTGIEPASLDSPGLGSLHKLRKEPATDRVQDQVDALLAALVLDVVPAETVEDPALARRHVHGLIAASEQHARIGNDRYVDAKVGTPVIVDVDVLRHLCPCRQTHEAAAPPDAADLRHDLLHIFAALEMLGRRHRPGNGVGRVAVRGDQANRFVAGDMSRMRGPGRRRKCPHFRGKRLGVEAYRQFQERLFQTHPDIVL